MRVSAAVRSATDICFVQVRSKCCALLTLQRICDGPMRVTNAAIDATTNSFAKSLLMQFLSFEA